MAKRAKQTISVEEMRCMVNAMLQMSEAQRVGIRQGAMNVLEEVLHRTGNYRGFQYLNQTLVSDGNPGIWVDPVTGRGDPATQFENTDNTRVQYI